MRLPASVSTFFVLLAALLGAILYVDSRDINTDVQTALESRLPQKFPADAETPFLRFPADWELAQDSPSSITLSTEGKNDAVHNLRFMVVNAGEEQSLETYLANFVSSLQVPFDPETVHPYTVNDLPAVRYVYEAEGQNGAASNFFYSELIRLDETRILAIQSPAPIPEDDWEKLEDELGSVLASLDVAQAPEVTAPVAAEQPSGEELPPAPEFEPAFTATPPTDQWLVSNPSLTQFQATLPDQTQLFLVVERPAMVEQILFENIFGIPIVNSENVEALVETLSTTISQGTPLQVTFTIAEEPAPTEMLGYEGSGVVFETIAPEQEPGYLDLRVVDTGENAYIFAFIVYATEEARAASAEQVEALLESTTFTMPPDEGFAPAQ